MKHLVFSIAVCVVAIISCHAQDSLATPGLQHIFDIKAELNAPVIYMGETQFGKRTIIPITGGKFYGPEIKGNVMSGGADYQLSDSVSGITHLHAKYTMRTDDGVDIIVENKGIISTYNGSYFFTSPVFEAPVKSKYSWLNEAIYVCRPVGGEPGSIILRVWRVIDNKDIDLEQ